MTGSSDDNQNPMRPAGMLARFGALFYDMLVGLAVLFIGTAITLPLTGGAAHAREGIASGAFTLYITLLLFVLHAWFWTRSGQTLGLKAWRLRLVSTRFPEPAPLNLGQAMIRFLGAIPPWAVFGLGMAKLFAGDAIILAHIPGSWIAIIGLIWLLLDQWPDGIRDRLSDSRVIRLPRDKGARRDPEEVD
ncbi:MAG: RDD family protein [Pseudomonadota bacterium]